MFKSIAFTAAALIATTSFAHASDPVVLYDSAGNAVVSYLTCNTSAQPVVLYTAERKPVAAYLKCHDTQTNVVVVKDKKGPIEQVVTGNRSQSRRVARRTTRRLNDD